MCGHVGRHVYTYGPGNRRVHEHVQGPVSMIGSGGYGPYIVIALYTYNPIKLWPYKVMAGVIGSGNFWLAAARLTKHTDMHVIRVNYVCLAT